MRTAVWISVLLVLTVVVPTRAEEETPDALVDRAARVDEAQAEALLERALALYRKRSDEAGLAKAALHLGRLHRKTGRPGESAARLEQAVRAYRRLRVLPGEVSALEELAGLQLETGAPGKALTTAAQAVAALECMVGGLADEEGARVRARYAELFRIGARAAVAAGDLSAAASFLESGRAGSFLEGLAGREALDRVVVPEALKKAEAEARAAEAQARARLANAYARGDLQGVRRYRRALEAAQAQTLEVADRVERDAKRQASLVPPHASTLEEIQAALDEHDVLVVYHVGGKESRALVVGAKDATVASLGSTKAIEEIVATLWTWDETDATERAASRLRTLLVEPLGLAPDVERVLIVPDGSLFEVPFTLLFPTKTPCLVPSGTAYVLLKSRAREGRGDRVLALGDPVYERSSALLPRPGRRFLRLPGTRREAAAVGDVVLLGAEATEDRFLEALAKEAHWRAVHLAVHFALDLERPALSALVMTPSAFSDGFLAALDIMRLRIHADLVVLSVNEGARGTVIRGEGLLGLPRAFLRAGAPRVIGTIGKADDEATAALMIRFHELYNPRREGATALGAAEALREAQRFVRDHERWRHPRYWASWVLWGLP